MLKIRLARLGRKKRPFYRIVATDSRSPRDGKFLEILGTYDPLKEPSEISFNKEKIDDWVNKGAQLSNRVQKINNNESTIVDKEIETFLSEKQLSLTATTDKSKAYTDADFIIVATPTSFDEDSDAFDTGIVDSVIADALMVNHDALVIIKSTIPVGHTEFLQKKHSTDRIIFSPEFL